ncbi:MAG: hypothetical protein IJ257_02515, partial [Treponema sp.]|nr:hypothetical protein [Treponema sp.]
FQKLLPDGVVYGLVDGLGRLHALSLVLPYPGNELRIIIQRLALFLKRFIWQSRRKRLSL